MPGGIDPHVHMHHVWIKPDGTPLVTAGPEHVGRAALFGGTTTLIDFAFWRDGVTPHSRLSRARDKDFVGKVSCDWAYHIMLHTRAAARILRAARRGDSQAGYPTLKIFTTNIIAVAQRPHDRFRRHLGSVSGLWRRRAGLASSTRKITTSSCTCMQSLSARTEWASSNLAEVHNQLSEDLQFPPNSAARRKCARHRALYDARFRGVRV